MKTLKAMVMGLALLVVCGVSQAASLINYSGPTNDEVVNTYLNAVVHGKLTGVSDIIDDEAQFNMKRGDKVNTMTKPQLLKTLESGENIEQDCQCAKTVLQNDDDKSVIKVDMKYTDFTRTDVITTERLGNGWKITKVETSIK